MHEDSQFSVLPTYIERDIGRLFCLFVSPLNQGASSRAILHVPAFAEEMNKSRLMVSHQARSFASRGLATLILDLWGTGDSDGEFKNVSWDIWLQDIVVGINWLTSQGIQEISIWGNRLGCALAIEAMEHSFIEVDRLLLWQPIVNGSQYLKQLVRVQKASSIFYAAESDSTSVNDSYIGGSEIGGYFITEQLNSAIGKVNLLQKIPRCRRLSLFEVSALSTPTLTKQADEFAKECAKSRLEVESIVLKGEPYWSTTEIVTNSELIRASTLSLIHD